jgi:uncharacterized membrane protein
MPYHITLFHVAVPSYKARLFYLKTAFMYHMRTSKLELLPL